MSGSPTKASAPALEFEYVDGPIGVIVHGVDWDNPREDELQLLTRALRRHLLVVLRGQASPTREQRDRFFERFGTLAINTYDGSFHYNLYSRDEKAEIHRSDETKENYIDTQAMGSSELVWHTDHFHKPQLKTISVLEAMEFEKGAAETYFRDMYTAYEMLPRETRMRLETKHATYFDPRLPGPDKQPRLCDAMHPVFTPHPETGRRALYIHQYSARIAGMSIEESDRWLAELREFSEKYAPFYSHPWHEGDLVFWDNIGLHHRRPGGGVGFRRVMRLYEGVAER